MLFIREWPADEGEGTKKIEEPDMHKKNEEKDKKEGGVYDACLCKMEPLEASPKNDIIVGMLCYICVLILLYIYPPAAPCKMGQLEALPTKKKDCVIGIAVLYMCAHTSEYMRAFYYICDLIALPQGPLCASCH